MINASRVALGQRVATPARACTALGAFALLLSSVSACHPIDTVRARRTARDGNGLYRSSDYRGAIAKYKEAIALDAETPNVYLNMGYALFSIYNPDSEQAVDRKAAALAIIAFDEHLRRSPDDEKVKAFRIKTFLRAAPRDKDLADQAVVVFTDLIKKNPADVELKQFLVTLFIDCQRYKQALEYYTPRLQEKPDDVETMKALAMIADKSNEIEAAVAWYRRRAEAVAKVEDKAPLYYELGTYVWNLLHYAADRVQVVQGLRLADEGIEGCKKAMALKPEYAEAMAYANLLYLKRANYEPTEAGKLIDQTLAFNLRTEAGKILMARKAKADAEKAVLAAKAAQAAPAGGALAAGQKAAGTATPGSAVAPPLASAGAPGPATLVSASTPAASGSSVPAVAAPKMPGAKVPLASLVRASQLPVEIAAAASGDQDVAQLMIKALIVQGYADGTYSGAERNIVADYASSFKVDPAIVDAIERSVKGGGTERDPMAAQIIQGQGSRQ